MVEVNRRTLTPGKRSVRSVAAAAKSDDRISPLRLHILCLSAAVTAAVMFTLTEHDDHAHTIWCVFEIIIQSSIAVLGTIYFRRKIAMFGNPNMLAPLLVMVGSFSMVCEPIQRLLLGTGHSFEMLIMHTLCNLMLALAVCGFRIPLQKLALLAASFLTLFCCTISGATGLLPLCAVFVTLCLTWLGLTWWDAVDRRLLTAESMTRPLFKLSLPIVLPLCLLLAASGFSGSKATSALRGFMPSSGGTGHFDPFSRGGVKDGDALVAGSQNIKSFAPLEDAPFLDSEKPSLYDLFNDTFDEPVKKIKEQQRAIPLPPEMLLHIHQQMADAKQAGREFELVRDQRSRDRRKIGDLETTALFYVAGRVPMHFRMESYPLFDGETWYPVDEEASDRKHIRIVGDMPWLQPGLSGRGFQVFSDVDTHSLKVANLDGSTIPSPPHLSGVSIPLVDNADFYRVSDSGIISLNRRTIPEMTPITLVSEPADRAPLRAGGFPWPTNHHPKAEVVLPSGSDWDLVGKIARDWAGGAETGMLQLEAIENRLRRDFQLDRNARIPAGVDNPVLHFLTKSKRGPEYLFASAAACLYRALGYQSRVVSGFYARSENYDQRKQHTAVFAKDAHFWCEVAVGTGLWLSLEPSPGYVIPGPAPTAFQQLWAAVVSCVNWLVANPFVSLLILTVSIALVVLRKQLSDAVRSLIWRLRFRRKADSHSAIASLSRLIDRRLKLAGQARSMGITWQRAARQSELLPLRSELMQLAAITDQCQFSNHPACVTHEDAMAANAQGAATAVRRLERRLSYRNIVRGLSEAAAFQTSTNHPPFNRKSDLKCRPRWKNLPQSKDRTLIESMSFELD